MAGQDGHEALCPAVGEAHHTAAAISGMSFPLDETLRFGAVDSRRSSRRVVPPLVITHWSARWLGRDSFCGAFASGISTSSSDIDIAADALRSVSRRTSRR